MREITKLGEIKFDLWEGVLGISIKGEYQNFTLEDIEKIYNMLGPYISYKRENKESI